jgi:hypothetical protein
MRDAILRRRRATGRLNVIDVMIAPSSIMAMLRAINVQAPSLSFSSGGVAAALPPLAPQPAQAAA